MLVRVLFVVVAYLLGAIPFGYLLVKFVFTEGEDIREVGSGGIGATNVTRRAGKMAGILTYILDVLKGVAAVMLMRMAVNYEFFWMTPPSRSLDFVIEPIAHENYYWLAAAALAAIVGHIFPVFLKFRGGKGVATGVGVFLVLAPLSVLSTLVLWLLIVYLTRYVSLGSIIATAAVPLWTLLYYGWLMPHPHVRAMLVVGVLGCALIVAKHHENIMRLMSGTENKIGQRISGDAKA